MKSKTQSSLLSFFSPPSSEDASAKKNKALPCSNKSSGEKLFSSTRKKIEFSPKLRQPMANKVNAVGDVERECLSSKTNLNAKRKTYEDFLGTSSEEDGPVTADNSKPIMLRKRARKIVVKDDDDSDDEPLVSAYPKEKSSCSVISSEEEWDHESIEKSGDGEVSEFSGAEEEPSDDDDRVGEGAERKNLPLQKRRKSASEAIKNNKVLTKPFSSPPLAAKTKWDNGASASSKISAPLVDRPVLPSTVAGAGNHMHDSLPWLHKDRRDINGQTPDSPDYDPRTLWVPPEFLKKETPAMVQWWEVKAQNMDTILFFKVGKFYELFHMDADVGFKELNLIYMKGEKAHSGFPEIAYSKMSAQLVAKGYRVARVEQTETPDMLKARNSTLAKKAKVVRREMCSLLSIGTNTASFLDAPFSSQDQSPKYLLALKETCDVTQKKVRFGICMVDCASGAFQLSEFDDTEQRDRLKTLFAQFNVVEIVTERFHISTDTKLLLQHTVPAAIRSALRVGKEFWDASKTVDEIERAGYFKDHGWPEEVLHYLEMDKAVKPEGQLAISALGGCIWHLRRSIIDQELLSLCNFKRYKPSDEEARQARAENKALSAAKAELNQQYVVLDSQTIQNLEVLCNSYNGSRSGSLIDIMDKTVTSFGRRMFQDWVLKPLCKIGDIQERLDAVEELGNSSDLMMEIRAYLRLLPDLERLLSRIHALGSAHRSNEHPDSRAIMYESQIYNVRKIKDFLAVLNGFDKAMNLAFELGPRLSQSKSTILQSILRRYKIEDAFQPNVRHGLFPDLTEKLEFFKRSFDQTSARTSGVIVPQAGVDPEFDAACIEIANVEEELANYLSKQRTALRCQQISYWGKKKEDRYQLEVPESALSKQPIEYELKSRKKGYKRFHTATIRALLKRLANAEDQKEGALRDQTRRIFYKFDTDYKHWMKAVQCLAVLDCLVSLGLLSSQSEGYSKPEVVAASTDNNGIPFIEIEEGVHPCVAATYTGGDFIPNDTRLGIEGKGQMVVLSGPNMGGKSTLLRQTCVLTLMAQIGSFVPATKCRLSPVDRIFTRIGASDRILAGQSTLFVELAETATILNHATSHSLVILDELGRGTSTFDGTAIAFAVIEHLLGDIQCRTMFATHYHSLVEEYAENDKVSLGHMGCIVDSGNERKVTFLYKLEEGMCPKSYGINVAMLANLPDEVIRCAAKKSEQFERSLQANSHIDQTRLQFAQTVKELVAQGEEGIDKLKQLWEYARSIA
ncbi:dna mismatch repair protein msh6 [Plasmopara halstedii]|uniref:DNA mismatch repair protein n=1 Tax=Plasmopara halstedii TaxID=4781 RepID=A0A0P1AKS9_PLAHL|nr:dna mismatch repair protein msh6 [Plasmopara halstedii]CEG41742.1 dna mismatch repair protein msh6 [Plasmopara halstedii]|eukprot:XP_024578111.1 dna mismatch repair protein msh6 [Plasmopara halstedii]